MIRGFARALHKAKKLPDDVLLIAFLKDYKPDRIIQLWAVVPDVEKQIVLLSLWLVLSLAPNENLKTSFELTSSFRADRRSATPRFGTSWAPECGFPCWALMPEL